MVKQKQICEEPRRRKRANHETAESRFIMRPKFQEVNDCHTGALVLRTFIINTLAMTHKHFSCDSDSRVQRV